MTANSRVATEVRFSSGDAQLEGELYIPAEANGVVLFAHGSGSSRHSPRNKYVARVLQESGIGTLLFDLLTMEEERLDRYSGYLRFDIDLLAERLLGATSWFAGLPNARRLQIGYFGSSTGAAAGLVAAAEWGDIAAIVSRGGRPDLASAALARVKAPTLLIVGARDEPVIQMNMDACAQLHCEKKVEIVRGATHLFEEPGALEQVARLATAWFKDHFEPRATAANRQG